MQFLIPPGIKGELAGICFDPNRPFNDLPDLPPAVNTETTAVFRKCISAYSELTELKISGRLIPNQAVLINSFPLLEAHAFGHFTAADDRVNYVDGTCMISDHSRRPTASERICP